MGNGSVGSNLQKHLSTLTHLGVVGNFTDGQLLERVVTGREETARAAFSALVDRHGPMVLGVCRQVLGDDHDTQDAFQATFLVLARKAGSVRKTDSVASWLHGVARRVALRTRSDTARRRLHETRRATLQSSVTTDTTDRHGAWPELHEEIARLPQRYREPVVLCYLEGLSTEAAARWIGCPQGTVLSRLSRARERLRSQLTRRGVALSATALAVRAASGTATAAVPPSLCDATVQASIQFAQSRATATLATSTAVALARGVLHTMTLAKLTTLSAASLGCIVALGGICTYAQFGGIGGSVRAPASSKSESQRAELTQAVVRLQAQLDESNQRNAELQNQLREIQTRLDKLGAPNQPGMASGVGRGMGGPGGAPGGLVGMGGFGGSGGSTGMGATGGMGGPVGGGGAQSDMAAMYSAMRGNPGMMPQGMGEMMHAYLPDQGMHPGGPDGPSYQRLGEMIFAFSATGDRVQFFDLRTNKGTSIRLPASKAEPLRVTPIMGNKVAALMLSGPKVSRIAAGSLSPNSFVWKTQDLREPVQVATPVVGENVVAYGLGRYVYAYSSARDRWATAELPEGMTAQPIVGTNRVEVNIPGHIYSFTAESGEWSHVDIRALLEKAAKDEDEPPAKR